MNRLLVPMLDLARSKNRSDLASQKQKEVVKHTFHNLSKTASCPSSFLPARLAVGLEAKKSSPNNSDTPPSCSSQNIGSPACFLSEITSAFICCNFIGIGANNARILLGGFPDY